MAVIDKVLKLMEREQITARKLTTELGLSNSSITEWRKAKAKPSLEAVVKIAGYFGVTTDFLLLEDVSQTLKQDVDINNLPSLEKSINSKTERSSVLSGEEEELLSNYHKLAEEDKIYIRCKMIVLQREKNGLLV